MGCCVGGAMWGGGLHVWVSVWGSCMGSWDNCGGDCVKGLCGENWVGGWVGLYAVELCMGTVRESWGKLCGLVGELCA